MDDRDGVLAFHADRTSMPTILEHLTERGRADVTDGLQLAGPGDDLLYCTSPSSPIHYLRLPIGTLSEDNDGMHSPTIGITLVRADQ